MGDGLKQKVELDLQNSTSYTELDINFHGQLINIKIAYKVIIDRHIRGNNHLDNLTYLLYCNFLFSSSFFSSYYLVVCPVC